MVYATRSLDRVFQENYCKLIGWCRKRVPKYLGDPEDFVHDAYVRCCERWSDQRKSSRNEGAYLFRALRWVVFDALRKAARRRTAASCLVEYCGSGHCWSPLQELIARNAVLLLRGKERQICLARMAGKNDEQVRCDLNLTEGALAVHVCRAQAKLRQLLEVA